MCNKAVNNYAHALKHVPEYQNTQQIFNKAVNAFFYVIQIVPECNKGQKVCIKAVNICPLVFDSVYDQYV